MQTIEIKENGIYLVWEIDEENKAAPFFRTAVSPRGYRGGNDRVRIPLCGDESFGI